MAVTRALSVSDKSRDASAATPQKLQSPLQRAAIRVLHNPMGIFGAGVLGILGAMAIFAPILAPYDPLAQHAGSELLPPNAQFWLGTDQFGRDELSRIMYGAQVSFIVAVSATAIGAVTGVLAGLLAGYARGGVDSAIMRVCDALFAFPA
ncbi:MAG TPA: ABC transporter permease, partial [Chloroflexota bacterium]